jgi:hypothetical protein
MSKLGDRSYTYDDYAQVIGDAPLHGRMDSVHAPNGARRAPGLLTGPLLRLHYLQVDPIAVSQLSVGGNNLEQS